MERGMRILIIDDEPQIRKLLKVSLGTHGYEIAEAPTGVEGINRAAIFKPDLLIVDLGLPDMDGKRVVLALREWTQAPIIVLTARDQEQEKIDALDSGADDYVTKPFSIGELTARMRVLLRRAALSDSEPGYTAANWLLTLLSAR
jgi:two-component system KDP operon response regulator KdpE